MQKIHSLASWHNGALKEVQLTSDQKAVGFADMDKFGVLNSIPAVCASWNEGFKTIMYDYECKDVLLEMIRINNKNYYENQYYERINRKK